MPVVVCEHERVVRRGAGQRGAAPTRVENARAVVDDIARGATRAAERLHRPHGATATAKRPPRRKELLRGRRVWRCERHAPFRSLRLGRCQRLTDEAKLQRLTKLDVTASGCLQPVNA